MVTSESVRECWGDIGVLEGDYTTLRRLLTLRAHTYLRDLDASEDAVNETFSSCWRAYRHLCLTSPERRALLYRVLKNHCLDVTRKRKNEHLAYQQFVGRKESLPPTPEEELLRRFDPSSALGRTLQEWLEQERSTQTRIPQAVLASMIRGETLGESAQHLGRSVAAIKSLRFRLVSRLRALYRQYETA